jgi:hypothetical protein
MDARKPIRPGRIILYVLAAIGVLHIFMWERWHSVQFDYLGQAKLVERKWWGFRSSSWDLAIKQDESSENMPQWRILVNTTYGWKWIALDIEPAEN